jgi:hypothetical protein
LLWASHDAYPDGAMPPNLIFKDHYESAYDSVALTQQQLLYYIVFTSLSRTIFNFLFLFLINYLRILQIHFLSRTILLSGVKELHPYQKFGKTSMLTINTNPAYFLQLFKNTTSVIRCQALLKLFWSTSPIF